MIKSKIDARERALELAVEFCKGQTGCDELVVRCAEGFVKHLIGDAELPEVFDDNGHLKELFEVAQRKMEKINKCDTPDYAEMLRAIQTGNAGISAEMPCKSEAEYSMSDKVNWKQARVDAAIGAMTAMLASPALMEVVTNPTNVVEKSFEGRVAKLSVQYADALIAELKKKGE